MDWNNDGKKDLILGEGAGYVKIYLNTNIDADPVFNGYQYLLVNGSKFDFGNYSSPYIFDWNNDNKKDVLVGEDNGKVYLLINTGTNSNPVFTSTSFIQDAGSTLDAGDTASPVVTDWTHDGKKDLLVGESTGRILFYENIGTDADPVFDGDVKLRSGGEELKVGSVPHLEIYDWNNDGLEDILCGYDDYGSNPDAGVIYFRALDLPVLDAKINGQDGPLFMSHALTVEFTISLDPWNYSGLPADYWVFATKDSGAPFWWQYPGTWQQSATPIRAIGFDLVQFNDYPIFSGYLAAGSYKWTFAVDVQNNNYEGTCLDSVNLTLF